MTGRLTAGLLAALMASFALAACEPKTPKPETDASAAGARSEALPGVVPHNEGTAPASDRPGAVTMGAVEAGAAGGGAKVGGHAAPTGGDASASAPAGPASQ